MGGIQSNYQTVELEAWTDPSIHVAFAAEYFLPVTGVLQLFDLYSSTISKDTRLSKGQVMDVGLWTSNDWVPDQ